MQNRVWIASAAALMIAACSGRVEVGPANHAQVDAAPRVRAAQRIELPGAVDAGAVDEGVAALAAGLITRRTLPETPEIIRLPDGTVGVKVAAQYYDTIVACRQSDGSYGTNCPPAGKKRP
jgi:hypothetical protein